MAAYYKNKNKKEINILLTDPGEEIDDEVAIECAVNTCQNSVWFVCCVPGCSSEDPDNYAIEIEKRLILFKKLFPSFEISNEPYKTGWYLRLRTQFNSVFYVGSPSMIFSNHLLTEVFPKMPYNENKLYVDNLIQIAPLWHIDPQLFNDIIIKNYIVMGDLDNPDQSLNLTKAMPVNNIYSDFRHEYALQQKIILKNTENILYITTNLARNVPLPYSLMRKLPNHLTDPLLNKAFTLCVSRVPADKCYANNISIVNHNTILNYCSESQKDDIIYNNGMNIMSGEIINLIERQTQTFLTNASDEDKSDKEYIKRLNDIAKAIYLITKIEYKNNFEFNFSEEGLIDCGVAKKNWLEHIAKYNCDLTPCYDLLAIIVKIKGYVPSIEECREFVLEF